MISWIILAIYVVGYIFTWRTTIWTVGEFDRYGVQDKMDIGFAVFFGSIVNLFWPPIIAFKILQSHDENWLMPRNVRKAKELKDRERRIAQLEKELNIKSSKGISNGY